MSQGNYDPRFSADPFRPQPTFGQPGFQQQPPKSNNTLWIILGSLGGGLLLLVLICCGVGYSMLRMPAASAAAKQPFNLAAIPVPAFPERGMPREIVPGVDLYSIRINGQVGGHYPTPGHGGTLFVYLPKGTHPAKSLPCVLITGAGTDLMQGVEFETIEDESEADEHLPYVKAGMAVVAYELDGNYSEDAEGEMDDVQMYKDFKASCAGMVNARNAFEFVLQKCPEVNPQQIFTAGHSSAGTAALLFAAHEPRLAGAVAYAPCSDVENFQPKLLVRVQSARMPGLIDFFCQSSPKTHHQKINCPVFLFSAEDDDVVEIKVTRAFEKLLKAHNNSVTLETVPSGDHYDSMIEDGIPKGVAWLKQRTGK